MTHVLDAIISQHAEEASALWWQHQLAATAAQYRVRELRKLDDRLDAHLDGLRIAGGGGFQTCMRHLGDEDAGGMFAAGVLSLEERHAERLDLLLATAEASPAMYAGLVSAFGWVPAACLTGIVSSLLRSTSPERRRVALASCAAHRVNPGEPLQAALHEDDPVARAEAYRTVGELGLLDDLPRRGVVDGNDECRTWAEWSSVLLGGRGASLEALKQAARPGNPLRHWAFPLVLQSASTGAAHSLLQELSGQEEQLPWLIKGSGIAGDPAYIGWLIEHMDRPATARLAGEAFTLVTGADLVMQGLDRSAPENVDAGPSDDPDDPNVDMNGDEGLPWPDRQKALRWWNANSHRFQKGVRYFMGAPVTRQHCIDILKNGCQRQRILAAHYLCLLDPGTPLFNTSAPAWRQQRLLAGM